MKRSTGLSYEKIFNLADKSQLTICITGHLITEYLLSKIIEAKFNNKFDPYKVNFSNKVKLCLAFDCFDQNFCNFLIELNSIRNKFAHQIFYKISFDEAHSLVKRAGKAGVEFNDNLDTDETVVNTHSSNTLLFEVFRNVVSFVDNTLYELTGEMLDY